MYRFNELPLELRRQISGYLPLRGDERRVATQVDPNNPTVPAGLSEQQCFHQYVGEQSIYVGILYNENGPCAAVVDMEIHGRCVAFWVVERKRK